MKVTEVIERIKTKGVPSPLFLVGDDPYFNYTVNKTVRQVLEGQSKTPIVWLEYEKYEPNGFAVDLTQVDLRFPVKVYFLRKAEKAPVEVIKKFLDHPFKNTYIIMQLEKIPEALQRKGMQADCEPLNERKGEVELWLQKEALSLEFKLHDTTARFLLETFGNDLGTLRNELEKAALLFPKKEVVVGDLAPIVFSVVGLSAPRLQSVLIKKDRRAFLNMIKDAEESQNLPGFVGLLFSFLDRWIVVRSVKTNDDKEAAQVLGKSPFMVKLDREHAKNFKAMALWRAVRLLASADRAIKVGRSAEADLFRMVEILCGT